MNRPFPSLPAALGLLGAALVGQIAASMALTQLWPRPDLVLLAGVANLFALGVAVFAGLRMAGHRPRIAAAGVKWQFWLALSLVAVGATVVLGEAANVSTWIMPLSPGLAALFNRLTGSSFFASLFTLSLVAPLTEEALFRGVLLPGFAQRWGRWPGIVLSSALFAAFHLNLWQAPSAFVAGLFLGWISVRTGSLLYPMAVHAIFNGFPVVLGAWGLEVQGYNTPLVPGVVEFQPPLWLATGTLVLAVGLWLARKTAPLSPPSVSDTVQE